MWRILRAKPWWNLIYRLCFCLLLCSWVSTASSVIYSRMTPFKPRAHRVVPSWMLCTNTSLAWTNLDDLVVIRHRFRNNSTLIFLIKNVGWGDLPIYSWSSLCKILLLIMKLTLQDYFEKQIGICLRLMQLSCKIVIQMFLKK